MGRRPLNLVSLFAGCGGFDLGFASAGFNTEAAFDSDANANSVYNSNLQPVSNQIQLTPEFKLSVNSEVVIAGPPCQGFSTASGYIKPDDRNSLLMTACKIAVSASAKVIVIENVSGLVNSKNKAHLTNAINYLNENRYAVDLRLLKCEEFGIAQKRRRVFIVARNNNRAFSFDSLKPVNPFISVGDIFRRMENETECHSPKMLPAQSKDRIIADHIGQGMKLCNVRTGERCIHTWDIPKVFGTTTDQEKEILTTIQKLRRQERKRKYGDADPVSILRLERHLNRPVKRLLNDLIRKKYLRRIDDTVDLTNTYNGKYRRLNASGLSPTVDTRFGEHRLFLHPTEPRGLTVREAARLQGFPDWFNFSKNERLAFRQVGNAVPPPVAKEIGLFVRDLV